MRARRLVLIGVGTAILLSGIVLVTTRHLPPSTHHLAPSTYYCPMHPSYTSARPGNCPICNMQLVKKESESANAPTRQRANANNICYLHNCAKFHNGKPCPMTVVAKPGEKVTCPICGTHIPEAEPAPASKKILYWTDPMIPGYQAAGPGKSPMGMDLVPVYTEESGTDLNAVANAPDGYAPILLTPQKQQLIGVRTAVAARRHLTKTIRAVGTIAHDPELYQAEAEYIQAIQALATAKQGAAPEVIEQAQRLADSTRIRLKHLGLSDDLVQEIATRTEPEGSLLYAHQGGPVWMYAQIYEYELPLVQLGQRVLVEVPNLPGETFEGAIRAIDQLVDPATRTTRIRARIDDPQGRLKPDMYINASIAAELGEALVVPTEAVFATGTKNIVFVDKGQGLFEPRNVTAGVAADGETEIKSGVSEGEPVVTSGNFLIDSESRLKAALNGITQAPAASAEGGEHQHGQ